MENLFLARQPIFDRDKKVIAYELLFRSPESKGSAKIADGGQATSQVILNALVEVGLDRLVGPKRRAAINMTEELLLDHALALPKDRVVLEIPPEISMDGEAPTQIKKLAKKGFLLALDNYGVDDPRAPLLKTVQIVKVDVSKLKPADGLRMKKSFKGTKTAMLAEKVETPEQFDLFRELGFQLFQGYFLCKPQMVKGRRVSGAQTSVLRLFSTLQDPNVSLNQVDELITTDVTLSYRLLKYLNSPFFGLSSKVNTIRHAAALLGMAPLKNWASLLTLSGINDKPPELLNIALVRASYCRRIAEALKRPDADAYFTLGLLSVLDALLDKPMEKVLEDLPMADDLTQALLGQEGEMGFVLKVVVDHEKGDASLADGLTSRGVPMQDIYLEALAWAEEQKAALK